MATATQTSNHSTIKSARIYLRVSTEQQDTDRQDAIIESARADGYHVSCVYREKASGARADRPELLRMIADLQPGEVVMAEKIDRISRLPLPEAEQLIASIKAKGAKLAIPGIVDLSQIAAAASEPNSKIVLEAMQAMLLRLALQMARDDYEVRRERQRQGIQQKKSLHPWKYVGRPADTATNERIVAFRKAGTGIKATAKSLDVSEAQVKRIWAMHNAKATE